MRIIALFFLVCFIISFATVALPQENEGMTDEEFREWVVKLIESIIAEDTSEGPIVDPGCNPAVVDVILRRLKTQQVTFAFDQTDFGQCIDFLRDITGMNFVLSRKAIEATQDVKVTMRLREIALKNALALLIDSAKDNLTYGIRFDVLYIGTKEEFALRGNYLIIYSLNEILYRPPDFPGPEIALPDDPSSHKK